MVPKELNVLKVESIAKVLLLQYIYTVYEGHFANGLRHGHGILRLANKNYTYEGGWAQDKMHGFGKLKMENGVHYEGYWDNNQFHGQVGFKFYPDFLRLTIML